ncbi:holo-[acyl-carrier-protein] synthase [Spiroplasma helicoides]|uniref:Holo-[acyl-carrier-protein] synthase n=1 Tax=Spiroplasma helicoides TaxID=216938 RepID=A0A1B3SL31_9MOLU|nr:4'-phosphopantetheinyl transferase superfamily protein [Spiroplasma helicoides]AOG60648.1 holo-[acyl-carrier-protein] synthase [Spiroplasma helicoides]
MKNIGIDIVQVNRIKLDKDFIARILHKDEFEFFNNIVDESEKIRFVAGRWAVKEAIFKVIDENISPKNISIGYKNKKPIILNDNLQNIIISISHEKDYAVAVALSF